MTGGSKPRPTPLSEVPLLPNFSFRQFFPPVIVINGCLVVYPLSRHIADHKKFILSLPAFMLSLRAGTKPSTKVPDFFGIRVRVGRVEWTRPTPTFQPTTNQKEETTLAKGTTFGGAGYLIASY
jgi:hypothetical protein